MPSLFYLQRRSGNNGAFQEIMFAEGIKRDVELTVEIFDLRSNGTRGNLPIPARIIDTRELITEGMYTYCI